MFPSRRPASRQEHFTLLSLVNQIRFTTRHERVMGRLVTEVSLRLSTCRSSGEPSSILAAIYFILYRSSLSDDLLRSQKYEKTRETFN